MSIYKKLDGDIVKVAGGNSFSNDALLNITEEYSSDKTYSTGSFCSNNGELFICISPTSAGEWVSSCWEKTLVCDNLTSLYGMSSSVSKMMNVFRGMSVTNISMFSTNDAVSVYYGSNYQVYHALGQIFISAEITTNYDLEPTNNNNEYDFDGPVIGLGTGDVPLSSKAYIHAVPVSSTGKLTAFIDGTCIFIKVLEPIPAFTKIHLSGSYVTANIRE